MLLLVILDFLCYSSAFTFHHALSIHHQKKNEHIIVGSPCGRVGRVMMQHTVVGLRLQSTNNIDNDNNDEQQQQQQPSSFTLKERNPYDVHVYYDGEDERKAAMELRQKMHTKFGHWMRFYNPKDRPIGPHPIPMWEADFGGYEHKNKWSEVRDFILEENNHGNNNNLSVLIHPHSLDGDYADHTKNAFWAGKILDLKIQGWPRN
jgi:aromatic ring-cleaving dioxygenase